MRGVPRSLPLTRSDTSGFLLMRVAGIAAVPSLTGLGSLFWMPTQDSRAGLSHAAALRLRRTGLGRSRDFTQGPSTTAIVRFPNDRLRPG